MSTSQVRGAFFEMLCAVCELTPSLAQSEAPRLCPAVLLSIDDTDPLVLPAVWESVLHVASSLSVSTSFLGYFAPESFFYTACLGGHF